MRAGPSMAVALVLALGASMGMVGTRAASRTAVSTVDHLPAGTLVTNAELGSVQGPAQCLWVEGRATVIVFFKPGQDHSRAVLPQIARLEKEFASKPVRWVGVVSDRIPRDAASNEVAAAGLQMPVLIDRGDALYARFGVVQEPAVGFLDREHRVAAFQTFARINFEEVLRARTKRTLGEINDLELDLALNPPPVRTWSTNAAAQARLRLSERLYRSGRTNLALQGVKTSLREDPSSAPAHVFLGQILSALGQEAEARAAYQEALKLDPANETARQGMASVGKSGAKQ